MSILKDQRPELNAGSMADIAFLLLIFFLVSTMIQEDSGIKRVLPEWTMESHPVDERNVFSIYLNENGELMANKNAIQLSALPEHLFEFMYNTENDPHRPALKKHIAADIEYYGFSSEPIVFLEFYEKTAYGDYIAVQDAIQRGYQMLREEVSMSLSGKTLQELDKSELEDRTTFKLAHEAFPVRLAEEAVKAK